MIPGEVITKDRDITLNEGRATITLPIANTGDRPVQVGSHFHFFEVNKLLAFDREASFGFRLNIPSGTSVRFEPGETKEVELVALGGRQRVYGLNNLTDGAINPENQRKTIRRACQWGFLGEGGHI
ncbi:MAG: urease subunit beta [Eubacteriales bacterium]